MHGPPPLSEIVEHGERAAVRSRFFLGAGVIGAGLFLLGGSVVVGWYAGWMDIVQVRSGYPPMQCVTAFVFLLGGAALLALMRGTRWVAAVIGAVLCLLGISLIAEMVGDSPLRINSWVEWFPVLPGAHPGRPAPVTVLCWTIAGALLMLLGDRRISKQVRAPLVWLGGMAMLFLCLLKLLGYFIGFVEFFAFGGYVGMAFHTALGMVLLAVGLLAVEIGFDEEGRLLESRWLPLVTGAASTLAVVLVWEGLRIDQYHEMEAKARLVADTLKVQLVGRINLRMRELDRMALRWEARGGTPQAEWRADAARHTEDAQSFLEMAWLDPAGRLQWMVPRTTAENGRLVGEGGLWNAAPALEKARTERCMVFSPTVDLMRGGRGFSAFRPLFPARGFDGFIVGVLRSSELFGAVFAEGGFMGYAATLCEGDEPVYLSPDITEALEQVRAETTLDLCGHQWTLVVSPTKALAAKAGGGLPPLILFLGLSAALALTLCVRTFQQAMAKTAAANAARGRLLREIVERQRIEEQLRHSEEQYRFMVNNVKDYAIFLLDPQGRAVSWNPGVEHIKGYTEAEFLGKPISAFYRPDDVAQGKPELGLQIAAEQGRYEDEGWRIRKDGTPFWAVATITALRDERGRLLGFTKFTHDLTEKKHVEDQLREESRKAQEANRLKGEFLTNMTHELRTPLNAIIGFSQFLGGGTPGPLNDKQKDFLNDGEKSGKHLLRLINDILDLAKIEAGKIDLALESFSVRALIDEVTGVLLPLLEEKHLSLQTELMMGDETVVLDLQKIRQALYNLLSNAIKFTDRGGYIFISVQSADPGFFEIRVTDTGIGIRKEDFSRLFLEFQQLDSGASRNYPGTGLGLVLVRKIVEGHGGSVDVASDYGRGTTFTIRLPRMYKKA